MPRKPPTKKQLKALEPGSFPKPDDAPIDEKAKLSSFGLYQYSRTQLAELKAAIGGKASVSRVVREAITFAHENKQSFLERFDRS